MRACADCGDPISRKNAYGYCSRTPRCRSLYQAAYQEARRPPTIPAGEPCLGCGLPTTSKYGFCKRPTCLEAREQVRSRLNYKPTEARRKCLSCGRWLPLNIRPYLALCRTCDGTRIAHRARMRKAETMLAYGGACACCGEDNLDFLTIDHVGGDGAADRKDRGHTGGGATFYTWLKARGYPDRDRYQVLCANCNTAKGIGAACPCRATRISIFDVDIPGQGVLF